MEIHDVQLSLRVFLSRSAIKSYAVPVPSLRNMCVKGDSIEFVLALQSIVNCSFLSYDRSCCVSASQKNKTETGVQSILHRFETDRKTKRPTGKKKRGRVSVFE